MAGLARTCVPYTGCASSKDGEVTGQTTVGVIPTEDELGMEVWDLPQADLDRILDIDIARWREEMGHRQEHLGAVPQPSRGDLGRPSSGRRGARPGLSLRFTHCRAPVTPARGHPGPVEHLTTRGDLPKGALQLRCKWAQVTPACAK